LGFVFGRLADGGRTISTATDAFQGVVMQDKAIALAGVAAVTVLAVAGLVLALIAPAQDP